MQEIKLWVLKAPNEHVAFLFTCHLFCVVGLKKFLEF